MDQGFVATCDIVGGGVDTNQQPTPVYQAAVAPPNRGGKRPWDLISTTNLEAVHKRLLRPTVTN